MKNTEKKPKKNHSNKKIQVEEETENWKYREKRGRKKFQLETKSIPYGKIPRISLPNLRY